MFEYTFVKIWIFFCLAEGKTNISSIEFYTDWSHKPPDHRSVWLLYSVLGSPATPKLKCCVTTKHSKVFFYAFLFCQQHASTSFTQSMKCKEIPNCIVQKDISNRHCNYPLGEISVDAVPRTSCVMILSYRWLIIFASSYLCYCSV